jgi:cytochrome c oxidase subunit IV
MSDQASSMRHTEDKIDSTHFAHHIVSPAVYVKVIIVLLILTIATVAVAYFDASKYWSLANLAIALGLATIKATIVALWFMHVKYSGKLIQIVIITSLMFFMLMLFGTLMDVWTRINVTPADYGSPEPSFEQRRGVHSPAGFDKVDHR